jgi:multidrug resistance protein MdtO
VQRPALFAQDALTNPEHLRFALKGGLAASICYVIYNAIAWPGISTCVTTCLVTALTTIGASRQKQILRIAGAIAGGFFLGIGSQIFILPYLDSIGGLVVLFGVVTALAAWFMTASPRLSYFGVQAALAFYFVTLQDFAISTSLSAARDRVVGILFGLFMMWIVFDRLWGGRAAAQMKRTFISNLRLVAQFAREPLSTDLKAATKRHLTLRETINANFDTVRALADGVLFEFGPTREQDLALRSRIRQWETELRMIFTTRTVLWKYRMRLPGFELPGTVGIHQREYDERSARVLEEMAHAIEGRSIGMKVTVTDSSQLLQRVLDACRREDSERLAAGRVESFVALLRGMDDLTASLAKEIAVEPGAVPIR